MQALIFALMCLLVPPKAHQKRETVDAARARYEVIAQAVAFEAGQDLRLALFLLTVARHESHYRLDIHDGSTRGAAGEVGLFQVMVKRKAPHRVIGHRMHASQIAGADADSTARAVMVAADFLRPRIKRCGGAPLCVAALYGGVSKRSKGKVGERLRARVATYERLRKVTKKERP